MKADKNGYISESEFVIARRSKWLLRPTVANMWWFNQPYAQSLDARLGNWWQLWGFSRGDDDDGVTLYDTVITPIVTACAEKVFPW